jgi:pimeloyl-ACP methyl ester carboxylesterase
MGCGHARGNVKNGTINARGVKIAYAVQGKGEPVILIHGWLSSGWINWDLPGTTRLLATKYQVITLDLPAHGRSDRPRNEEAFGLELVEDVIRVMDHLKIKKAHIVGYSMGGIITAKLLAKHPERVLSGVLGGMGWLREGSVEQAVFSASGKDGQPVGVCFRSLAKLALTEKEIKSIRVPVLILFGDDDGLKRPYADPLKTIRPDWSVIDIKGANHISCTLRPQFKEEIRKWLDKQTKR